MNKNALGRSLFYFLFLSLSLCSQPPQRPPDLDRDKRGKCSSRTYFEEKHVLKKKIHGKKTKTSLFLFFFFFFLRVSVKGKKKSAGFFLSLSYYLQSRSMSPMLSFSRVCQKKQERKLYLGNKSKGEILPISFLPFRRSWASQVEKNQKKTLSLSVSFFLSRPSRRASPSFKFIFIFLASYM